MIIFLYGPDSYRRQQKLKGIVEEYKKKHPNFVLEKFDLLSEDSPENAGLEKLKDFVKSRSLFDEIKLGVVENGSSLEKSAEKEYLDLLKENLTAKEPVLVILGNKVPTKDFQFLLEQSTSGKATADKPVQAQEFELLTGDRLVLFIQMEMKKRGLALDSESQELLARVYGGNTWGLVTELEKLALLNEKKINKGVLEKHLDLSLAINVYDALGALKNSGRPGTKLKILEELFSRANDPAMIFNMYSIFSRTPEDKSQMADYDAAIKSGKLEYEEALLSLCL